MRKRSMILPIRLSETQRTVVAYFALFVSILCVIVSCATTTYSYLHHVFVVDISLLVRGSRLSSDSSTHLRFGFHPTHATQGSCVLEASDARKVRNKRCLQ